MASHERFLPRAGRDDPSRVRELAHDGRVYLARLTIIATLTVIVVLVWSESTGGTPQAVSALAAPVRSSVISAPLPETRVDLALLGTSARPQLPSQTNAIPRPPEFPEPARPMNFIHFVVQPGDTIFVISLVYGVAIDDILVFNPDLGDGTRVDVGQVVIVPIFRP